MKLKNEYQIASTCLFVKSIRQSKRSSFEHIEIFICIKISRYAQGTGAPNDNFRTNICSEDDLRSRIFGTFVVKFIACLPLLGFSNI